MPALVGHPLVWCSPHIGASTLEAQIAIGHTVLSQVEKAVEGGVVEYPVNLPEVAVIDSPILKAYAVLAEKLGATIGQILDFNPQVFEISYRGDLAELNHSLIRLTLMKGYMSQVLDDYVSFVNVASHSERLGIVIKESTDPGFQSYKSAIKIKVIGTGGRELRIGGVVFEDRYLRMTLINDFYFEIEPNGELLLIENVDRPGVIGDVGHFLGSGGININSFTLSRNRQGGHAMAIVRIDSPLAPEALEGLKKISNVVGVHAVKL